MPDIKKKIVLFTTDDVGAEMTSVLLNQSYKVIRITSAADPLLASKDIALILCDELFLTGDSLCSYLNDDIPMLLLSDKSEEEISELLEGSDKNTRYFQKPFSPDQLKSVIETMIEY